MRRGAGISSLSRHTTTTSSYAALSNTISSTQLSSLQSSLAQFHDALVEFAISHKEDIKRDPAFRHQFQKMCAAIGVDPLAGSTVSSRRLGGGMWSEMLGLGETVYEISVQVVDVCISTRGTNGGMIELGELTARINRMRGVGRRKAIGGGRGAATDDKEAGSGSNSSNTVVGSISPEDVLKAIDLLKPLYAGYTVVSIGHQTYIRSVPRELDTDQSTLLTLAASSSGRLSRSRVKGMTGWADVRITTALDDCVMREGMGWVDDQAGTGEKVVWLIAAVSFEES